MVGLGTGQPKHPGNWKLREPLVSAEVFRDEMLHLVCREKRKVSLWLGMTIKALYMLINHHVTVSNAKGLESKTNPSPVTSREGTQVARLYSRDFTACRAAS